MVKEILTDDGQLEEVEMDEVKSSNKELKSKIRTSKTPLEILYYYKELMND